MRLVYAFDEEAPGGRELLGGKGVGLAEMTALGVPVPAGFTTYCGTRYGFFARSAACSSARLNAGFSCGIGFR